VKQFAFELLIIDLLSKKKAATLAEQHEHVWTELRDQTESPSVQDPANPTGDDLTPFLTSVWAQLSSIAGSTLTTIQDSGWEFVFGSVEKARATDRVTVLRSVAAAVTAPTKPWCDNA
jgi:hypothetical protein